MFILFSSSAYSKYDSAGCEYIDAEVTIGGVLYHERIYSGNQQAGGIGPCPWGLCCASTIAHNGDNGNWGTLIGTLNDTHNAAFKYAIGNIIVNYGSIKDTLSLNEENGSFAYLKSSNFTLSTSGNISFVRMMDFDDNLTPSIPTNWGSLTVYQQDSFVTAFLTVAASKEVSPGSSYFTTGSYIQYIVEADRASDSSVIQILDTLTAYKNGDGNLRFITSNNSSSKFSSSLVTGYSGTSVFLRLRVLSSLGSSGSLSYLDVAEAPSTYPVPYATYCGLRQENCSSEKIASNTVMELSKSPIVLSALNLQPNPSSNQVSIHLQSSGNTIVNMFIYDLLGKTIQSRIYSINNGENIFLLDISSFPSGRYYISLYSDNFKGTLTLDKIK